MAAEGRGTLQACFRPLESGASIIWKQYRMFPRTVEQFLRQLQQELFPIPGHPIDQPRASLEAFRFGEQAMALS